MISQEMVKLGTAKSIIRELAAFGAMRAAEIDRKSVV